MRLGHVVGYLHVGPVPMDFLPGGDGQVAQQNRLGHGTGVIEVRARRLAALTRVDPFLMMPRRTRQRLGRLGGEELFHLRLGDDPRAGRVRTAHELALLADENHAADTELQE